MLYDKWIRDWKTALAENFFLRSVCMIEGIALIIMGILLFTKSERILLVPPHITRDSWVERDKASPELLEQMAVFLSSFGTNLSPANADYSVDQIIRYYLADSVSDDVRNELRTQASYLKKNNLTQSFFPSQTVMDYDNSTVTVMGTIGMNIGATKLSSEKAAVKIRFHIRDYQLKIEEFVISYPDREKKEKKEMAQEQAGKSLPNAGKEAPGE